jgi:hypothetical protein
MFRCVRRMEHGLICRDVWNMIRELRNKSLVCVQGYQDTAAQLSTMEDVTSTATKGLPSTPCVLMTEHGSPIQHAREI